MKSSLLDDKTENMKQNLVVQIDKLREGTNHHSIETRWRYYDATERFCGFLAQEFKLQKFENIKEKHLDAYVKNMLERGIDVKTIKTDLSGIRFFHNLSGSKFELPGNKKYNLPASQNGVVDRSWSKNEIEDAKIWAGAMGREDVKIGIDLSSQFGLRINELSTLTVKQIKDALNNNELFIKGKGGVERNIPVRTEEQISALQRSLDYAKENGRTAWSDKVLSSTERGGVLHEKQSLQNWISDHRAKFQEEFRTKYSDEYEKMKQFCEEKGFKLKYEHITWHGLRHGYAQSRYNEIYNEARENGFSHDKADRAACHQVSLELGHYRDSITRLYLSTK